MENIKTKIRTIYDDFLQNDDYDAFCNTKYQEKAEAELTQFLSANISKDKVHKADDLVASVESASEERGFIMGFKYAVQLMGEVYHCKIF